MLLFARTDTASRSARGVSAFILDTDQVTITRTEEKLGLNSSVDERHRDRFARRGAIG